jgi:hypothetical protein
MSQKIGDFPAWAVIMPFAPAALCKLLGFDFASSFLVYLAITAILAILVQLDRIETCLKDSADQ